MSLRNLWLRWKMLKLPWRTTFLIGQDLQGNTYWEFARATHSSMTLPTSSNSPTALPRRIVKYRGTHHMSDVQVSPQWHQWLRRTRIDPPTIREQQMDVVRQAELREGARLADARWEAKEGYIAAPKKESVTVGRRG